tara:strand:+ start:62 stop:961 length:900 start_codon:yes stop_codon:yes gene_type:complete
MPELAEVEKPKVAGYVNPRPTKNKNQERIEEAEKELEQLSSQAKGDGVSEAPEKVTSSEVSEDGKEDANLSKEELTFKKRYGDLRRHLADKEKGWNDRISNLEKQLDLATKNELVLPKSEDEIDAWSKKYPDVAGIVETIASKKAKEASKDLDQRVKEIEGLRESAKVEKAEAELLALHPDFNTIREQDDFHDWAEKQPKWIQDALYENATDARSAARVIDLYKADNGISTKSNVDLSAAKAVAPKRGRSTPQADVTASYLKESVVNKMSAQEYEKNQDKIMEAIRTGQFVYDLSGGAR